MKSVAASKSLNVTVLVKSAVPKLIEGPVPHVTSREQSL